MKFAINIIILLSIFSCQEMDKANCNYKTDYYQNTAQAEIEYYLGNYEKSFELYQKAFRHCEALDIGTHNDTSIFARVCAELGEDDLAFEYIEKGIASGGTIEAFRSVGILNNLLNTERGQKIISGFDQKRTEFTAGLDMDLRAELQNMIRLDQSLNSTKLQDSMFQANDKRLVEIFEKYGYPDEQITGPYYMDQINADPSILLLHTDDSIRINYFIPKIKEYVENGKCSPYVLGTLLDNLALFNGEPQTHGTYLNGKDGYANMIPNKSKVNANRRSIGLPTMEISKKLDSLKIQYLESR